MRSDRNTARAVSAAVAASKPGLFSRTCTRLLALALSTLWLIVPALADNQASEEDVVAHFRAGQQAMKDGDFARASEEFKKVLTLDPQLMEAEVNLGLAYQSMYQYEFAIRHLLTALQQRPNLAGPNLIVGMDYLKLGSPAKAASFLLRALKLDPTSRDGRRALASSYESQNNFRGAAEEFRQAAVLDQDQPEALFKLGHDYLELSARLAYRGAHLYRDSAWGRRFIADLLFQRSQWESAAQEYRKALEVDPHQSGLHTALGQIYLHEGKIEQAEAEFRLELNLQAQSECAWLGLAEKNLRSGETADALQAIWKVWEISPEYLAAQPEFPTIEFSAQAARTLISKIGESSESASKEFLLASLYLSSGDGKAAQGHWQTFQGAYLARQRAHPAGFTAIEDICKAHHYAACVHSLEARKTLTVAQRLYLGRTHYALRRYGQAVDTLSGITGISNENVEANYWLALSFHALGASAYQQLEESFPNSWRTHQLRGEGFGLAGDLDNALKEFQFALELSPNNAELHEALGEVYLDKNLEGDTLKELAAALALDPSRTHALCMLGRLYVQERANDKAVPYLQAALRQQPDLVEASNLLGTAYVRLGQFAQAIPNLQKAAAMDLYGNVHYELFVAYRGLGKSEFAQQALARSQELRRSSLERDQAVVMGVRPSDKDPQ